jgi:predicted anti-sigma-YlaC factor YlaD
MNCNEARELFWSDADGELAPNMRELVHQHRLTCPDCARAWEEVGRLTRAFATAREVRAPSALAIGLLARARHRPRAPRAAAWHPVAAMFAGVGLWLAASLAWRSLGITRPQSPMNSEPSIARHLATTLPLLQSGASDSALDSAPELRLLATLHAKKGE